METRDLRRELEEHARADCMDFVGVAPTERFAGVHHRMRPEAHLDGAGSVVSIGMRYPLAMYENAGRSRTLHDL